jgi:osmoprotectant transport system substrate-binding protein
MNRTGLFSRVAAAGVAVAVATTLAACSSSGGGGSKTSASSGGSSSSAAGGGGSLPGKGKPAITMGDKNFAEEYLLGELYSQALKAKGYTVTLKGNIGSSAVIDKALTSGQIDMYPEYTGVIYTELAKLGDRPKSAATTLQGATSFEAKRGFSVLSPTPFQDADGLAVLKAYASQHGLKTIADMSKVGSFSYGGPPENGTRYQGVVGLKQAYGLNKISFKPLPIGTQYQALDQKKINSIAIFTTDGQLASGKYSVLTDTKGIFGFQQVVPVIKKSVLDKMGPAFSDTLNKVSALLTTKAIVTLNKAVQIDQQNPGTVAKAFLKANGLA